MQSQPVVTKFIKKVHKCNEQNLSSETGMDLNMKSPGPDMSDGILE